MIVERPVPPRVRSAIGAIFATSFGDIVQPIKKRPSAIVEGRLIMSPAVFSEDFSARMLRRAMNEPPTRKDNISWMMKVLSMGVMYRVGGWKIKGACVLWTLYAVVCQGNIAFIIIIFIL